MSRKFLLFPAVLLCALAFHLQQGAASPQGGPGVDLVSPAVPGELLVHLNPSQLQASDAELGEALGGTVAARFQELAVVRLKLGPDETLLRAIERLQRLKDVKLVEPNHLIRASVLPNDPYFAQQQEYLDFIEAPLAWDIESGDDSVIIAVLDSGIDAGHPDLAGVIFQNAREIAGNGVDDDNNECVDDVSGCAFVAADSLSPGCTASASNNVNDDNGHGSFVAGIIAATSNNLMGISGAAPGVRLLTVKILDCAGGGTAAGAAQGLLYAARMGARIANVSFGAEADSQTLAAAIRDVYRRYGMIVVAASGNEGKAGVSFPARLTEAIGVGSSGDVGNAHVRSPFSDWGTQIDVAAPGFNILSTVPAALCGMHWHCIDGQPYAVASGTSFAAPFVSALAGLLVSKYPYLSPETVRGMIIATAQPLPDGDAPGWDGAGRIRMKAALGITRYHLGAPGTSRR